MFEIFFQKYINIARKKCTWRDNGMWDKQRLSNLYDHVKNMFDFNVVSNRNGKYKLFEQQI